MHELLDQAVTDHPAQPALAGAETRSMSYRELGAASRLAAKWLWGHGVRTGDRVVVGAELGTSAIVLAYGCSRLGAVFVPLPAPAPAVLVAHVLADIGPALVVSDQAEAGSLAAERGIPHFAEMLAYGGVPGPTDEFSKPRPIPVDPAIMIYTSGSTSMPKAVVSSHAQVTFAVGAIQSELEYRQQDVVFCPLPLAFDYGLYQAFLCALAGACLWLGSVRDTGHLLVNRLVESRATVLPAVPSLAANLSRLLARRPDPLPHLRLLTNTGAAMPVGTLAELRRQLPALRIQLMFGLTECKRVSIMPKDEDLRRPGAVGRPLPGTEVSVVDPAGRRLPAGEEGEFVIRGPHVMEGYWRRPELTSQRFPSADGMFRRLRTGDFGRVDSDGYLYFTGRRDDIYKERGVRVSAIEVEAAARRVAGVEAAAVILPDDESPGATLAVVTSRSEVAVLEELTTQLGPAKTPARCIVVDVLPLTANGKVDRAELTRRVVADDRG